MPTALRYVYGNSQRAQQNPSSFVQLFPNFSIQVRFSFIQIQQIFSYLRTQNNKKERKNETYRIKIDTIQTQWQCQSVRMLCGGRESYNGPIVSHCCRLVSE